MNLTGPVILAPGDTVSSLNPLSPPQTHFALISASYPSISFPSLSPSHPLSLSPSLLPLTVGGVGGKRISQSMRGSEALNDAIEFWQNKFVLPLSPRQQRPE